MGQGANKNGFVAEQELTLDITPSVTELNAGNMGLPEGGLKVETKIGRIFNQTIM